MKKQKSDYTELQCKNFLERGYNIVLTEFKNGRPEGVWSDQTLWYDS